MRRRLLDPMMTSVAIGCVAVLVGGCSAQVWGSPPSAENPAPAPASAPVVPLEPAPVVPAVPLDGLDVRVRQASADASKSGANITVAVLDRETGQTFSAAGDKAFPIASVVKLFIADDLLLQDSQGKKLSAADRQALDGMLRASDDGAAQTFWDRNGQNAILARVVARYGLRGTTAPANRKWDVTLSTASDLVRYYAMLLDGSGGLPPEQASVIIGNLAQSTPTGNDGYPQRFGIPEGLFAERVAVKQGWFCCWNGGNQLHVSTGTFGPGNRYVMAISSLDPKSAAAARQGVTQAVKTIFPGGKV